MAVVAGTVARPDSVAEAADLLRDTRGPLLFRGGGTKMAWGGRPDPPDVLVETSGLHRLLAHNPADMTTVVEAGMPLSTLQDVLAESGQWLALDPATQVDGATIGGLLATGESGPRRLRYGALRDLVIGVRLVLGDGTDARAGGRVIKNVAGYDLTKLMYGSLGTLALVDRDRAARASAAGKQQQPSSSRHRCPTPPRQRAVSWRRHSNRQPSTGSATRASRRADSRRDSRDRAPASSRRSPLYRPYSRSTPPSN